MIRQKPLRRWIYRRVVRLKGTPDSIAGGMALGVLIGCLVPPGLQILAGVPLALLLGANVFTMSAGTFISNPFTYVFLYYWTCHSGAALLRAARVPFSLGAEFRELLAAIGGFNVLGVLRTIRPILHCWVLGGLVVGLACSVPAYYVTYLTVVEVQKLHSFAQQRRIKRRRKRLESSADQPDDPSDGPD